MSEVFKSLRRTPYQSLAAFSVLFFTLLLSGVLIASLSFLQGLLNYVETRPRVIVYFQTKTTESEIFKVKEALMATGKVTDAKYVSKTEAYNIYKEYTKNDPLLQEMTSADILPASLEVDAKQPSFLPEIADFLGNQPGVDEVQYQQQLVENLLNLTSAVRKSIFIFFGYLLFMAILVLTTTTSFKIAMKKDEIELMKLLGASNFYIRKPFLKESMTLGLLSTIFANAVLIGLLISLNPLLSKYLVGIPHLDLQISTMQLPVWPFNPVFYGMIFALTALFSMLISLIATYASTNKYLD